VKPPIPERIRALEPYKPGKPIEEVERELGLRGSVKLASNENALGPSPRVIRALTQALPGLHRYPDGSAVVLTTKLAAHLGVPPECIVLGNGSNEMIELLVRLFAAPGDEVIMSEDAFLVYDLVCRAVGARPVKVKAKGFHHDLEALAEAVGEKTRLVFLANPNNPTGTIFTRAQWESFLPRIPARVVVVVDQAYCEYVDDPAYPDTIADHGRHPGLVTLRTFSKVHSLAGLRVGYAVGSSEIIDALGRFRQPFNVNSLAQVAACAALDDREHLDASRALARSARAQLERGLAALEVDSVPSHANFVLCDVGDGAAVTDALLHRGVIVRPMFAYGFPHMIRVTYGTDEENQRFLEALAGVFEESRR